MCIRDRHCSAQYIHWYGQHFKESEKYVLQNQRNTLKKYPRNTHIVKSETTGGDSAVLCWAIYLLEWSARLKNASQIDFYGCNNSHRKLCSAASHQIQYNRKNLNEIQIQIQTQIWMQIKHKYTLTFMPAIVNFSMTCQQWNTAAAKEVYNELQIGLFFYCKHCIF